jgi:hypothetical protein
MAEQPPIVAKIHWAAAYDNDLNGRGLSTAYIVNAMRDYFNDTSIPHYWEVDGSIPGGDYDMTTSISPYDTAGSKHTTLVLKPTVGAPGGSEQRIVFITRGNPAISAVGWGAIMVGYLPDGVFDPVDGVTTDNPADINDVELLSAPTSWSGFRNLSSITTHFNFLMHHFYLVEYRDDPSKFLDPGQSLFVSYSSHPGFQDILRDGTQTELPIRQGLDGFWEGGCLVGRILQPFTRYHELAVGNKGDALWTGKISNVPGIGNRPMMEAGWNATVYINHSSINRVAPNCWAHSYPGTGFLRNSGFLGADDYNWYLGDYPAGSPFMLHSGPAIVVRDGVRTSIAYDGGLYATCKYVKQFNWDVVGGAAGLIYDTQDPASSRAWYSPPNHVSPGALQQSRFLLWNKNGATNLNYYQP